MIFSCSSALEEEQKKTVFHSRALFIQSLSAQIFFFFQSYSEKFFSLEFTKAHHLALSFYERHSERRRKNQLWLPSPFSSSPFRHLCSSENAVLAALSVAFQLNSSRGSWSQRAETDWKVWGRWGWSGGFSSLSLSPAD